MRSVSETLAGSNLFNKGEGRRDTIREQDEGQTSGPAAADAISLSDETPNLPVSPPAGAEFGTDYMTAGNAAVSPLIGQTSVYYEDHEEIGQRSKNRQNNEDAAKGKHRLRSVARGGHDY